MVLLTKCSFCGKTVAKGTGKICVKSDGTIYLFCSRKCESNLVKLGRKPEKTRWTEQFRERRDELRAHQHPKNQ
ncbi:MAG: 50S ribosomal protein L24e [archaeon]